MHAFLILCDFAETINGKLYIQGGGWTRLATGGAPVNFFLAGKIFVPWTNANRQSALSLSLVTEDGNPVFDPNGSPVHMDGGFEVGRPPGTAAGTELDVPLTFRLEGLPMLPGRYRWELKVDGVEMVALPFTILAGSVLPQ